MYIGFKSPISKTTLKMMVRRGEKHHFQELIFTFMGRDAISFSIEFMGLTKNDRVLLPAYLCPEVLYPFAKRIQVRFYDIIPTAELNIDEIKKKIIEYNIKALFIIHYFGFAQKNMEKIKELCIKHNVYLIEDCAQSMLSEGCGNYGDIIIYSLRKLLPLLDGGGLRVNVGTKMPQIRTYPQIFSDFLALIILFKSTFHIEEAIFSRSYINSMGKNLTKDNPVAQKILNISTFSRNILSNLDLTSIIEKRRRNFILWKRLLQNSQFLPLFHDIPEGVCPLGFPVKIDARDELIIKMMKKKIMLKVHWPLPKDISNDFRDARDLSLRILTLPVYPELDEKDIVYIYKSMESIIGGEKCHN